MKTKGPLQELPLDHVFLLPPRVPRFGINVATVGFSMLFIEGFLCLWFPVPCKGLE